MAAVQETVQTVLNALLESTEVQEPPHIAESLTALTGLKPSDLDPLANVKQQVLQAVQGHIVFFISRAVLGCVLLHWAKAGLRRLFRRHGKKAKRRVRLVTNVMLPHGFFGPALGISIGVMELTGTLPRLNLQTLKAVIPHLHRRTGVAGTAAAVGDILAPAAASLTGKALTAVLQQTGAAEGTPLGPGTTADALQDKVPGIPADSIVAPVGALVGLPIAQADTESG